MRQRGPAHGGTPPALLTPGTSAEGTLVYAIGTSEAPTGQWSDAIPTAQDLEAGTCYVWYKVVGDAEHSDSQPQSIAVTVAAIPGYELTLAEGSEAHGTVAFTIGGQAATEAKKDDVVTLTVTPEEGWIVTQITAETYNNWESAGARRTAPVSVPILGDVELTPVEGTANAWTFQMPAANVEVAVSYAQPYTVRVAAGRFTTFFAGENIQLDQQTPEGVTLHTITGISDTEAAMQAADYYLLSGGKAFAKVYGAGTLTKNQCWLQFDKQQVSGARSISLVFEGETTKIENGKLKMENSAGAVYDLQGRRVESSIFRSASPLGSSKNSQSSNLKKGVYVKDGRKVVVK